MNVIEPCRNSLVMFLKVWRTYLAGAFRYWLEDPVNSIPCFWNRFKYACLKRSVTRPFLTPEGFSIESNQEMITHSSMFIEETLFSAELIDAIACQSGIIVDVGACYGMFSLWIESYCEKPMEFICIEPYQLFAEKGSLNMKDIPVTWIKAAASNNTGDAVIYREPNSLVTFASTTKAIETMEINCITIDGLGLDSVLLLKIDTDGHNQHVLEGAMETLKRTRFVLIEKEPGVNLDSWFPGNEWKPINLPNTKTDVLYRRIC